MKHLYASSMIVIFVLAYLNELTHLDEHTYIALTAIAIVCFLVSAISMIRGFQLYISVIALVAGHLILFAFDLDFQDWYVSITKTLGMIVLFTVTPLISFPIRHGQYLDSIQSFIASKRTQPGFLLTFLATILLSLAVVLNIGSVSTMQGLLRSTPFPQKYLARMYTTGYTSYMVFSPYDAGINMFLMFASTTYSEYVFSGMSMVVGIMLVSALLLKTETSLTQEVSDKLSALRQTESPRKMYEFLGHIVILILLAVIGDRYAPFSSTVFVVGLIIIGYSLVWGKSINALSAYRHELRSYSAYLLDFKHVLPFLISTSFLASMVSYTPFKNAIGRLLTALHTLPQLFILQLIIVFIMLLSLCGIHMMITVSTLAFTVNPAAIGLSNPSFGLLLLTCWYMSMSICPFAPFAVVLGEAVGEQPFTVTFRYNLKFALVMLCVAPLIILLTNVLVMAW